MFNENGDENSVPAKQEGAVAKAAVSSQPEEEDESSTAVVPKDFDKEKARPTLQVIRKYIQ